MTDLDTFLAHYGVKGMKWGVRNDNAGAGKRASEKKIAKLDKKFEKGATSKQYFAVYNAMADKMNKTEIDRINNDPRFKGKDMSKPGKLQDDYYNEYSKTATKALNDASADIIGSNASGTKIVQFEYNVAEQTFPRCFVQDKNVKHADDDRQEIELKVDSKWFITSMKLPSNLAHSDDFLAHYGVKGMKWGVRRGVVKPGKQRTSREDKVRAKRKDAQRRRQTLKDKDLDQLVKRLEQEKKLKSLLDEDLRPGRTAAKKLLSNSGTKVAGTVLAGAGVWAVKTALEGGFGGPNNKDKLVNLGKELATNIPKLKK